MAREREADVRRSLDRLASLRIDPEARARLAATLIEGTARADLLMACAASLEEHPVSEAREPLISAYERVSADAKKVDAGGELRAALLRALRPVAGRQDIALLEAAAQVYETSVQGPGATGLRAAAVVALTDVAPDLAVLHAVRLLAEADDPRRTGMNTGEPAVTAARVLGVSGEMPALYLAATMNWRPPEEVLAECLRQLTELPGPSVAGLVERYREHRGQLVQLGLVDLVVENPDVPGKEGRPYVSWLRGLDGDVFRYALAAFVASRRPEIHELAASLVEDEFNRDRLGMAVEAFALARGAPALDEARARAKERLATQGKPGRRGILLDGSPRCG